MSRKRLAGVIFSLVAALAAADAAAAESLLVEDMTWVELSAALRAGKQTAIVCTGSMEQNGPHMVLGKHNRVARHLALEIARELGDALVYPIAPFAPNGDPASRAGHLRFPGTVSLRETTFVALVQDVAVSAIAAGFRRILIMADHGDGQEALAALARELDAGTRPHGVRVIHVGDSYKAAGGGHAGREDTAMLLAIDGAAASVRRERMTAAAVAEGADADPSGATAEEGHALLAMRVRAALAEVRRALR